MKSQKNGILIAAVRKYSSTKQLTWQPLCVTFLACPIGAGLAIRALCAARAAVVVVGAEIIARASARFFACAWRRRQGWGALLLCRRLCREPCWRWQAGSWQVGLTAVAARPIGAGLTICARCAARAAVVVVGAGVCNNARTIVRSSWAVAYEQGNNSIVMVTTLQHRHFGAQLVLGS